MNEKANDFLGGSSDGELFEHDEHTRRFDRPAFIIIRGPSDDDEPIIITLPEVLAEAVCSTQAREGTQ